MNQGKMEVVKQEMARVNVDILGISELKWTGMGEFNSDDQYIYYCGQESLRRNGIAIMVNKSPKCSTWMQSKKRQNDLCSFPRQTIQYPSNPSLCPDQQCWRSWSWIILWRPTGPSKLTPKKDVLFIIGDLNAKVGSQETPEQIYQSKYGLGNQVVFELTVWIDTQLLTRSPYLFTNDSYGCDCPKRRKVKRNYSYKAPKILV